MTARIVLEFDTDAWRDAWRELATRRRDWSDAIDGMDAHAPSAAPRHLLPVEWVEEELAELDLGRTATTPSDADLLQRLVRRDPLALDFPVGWWEALELTAPWEALLLRAPILFVKEIERGTPVSYGFHWRAQRTSVVATVGVGYGDGYRRAFSNTGVMRIGGRSVSVVGRVCMDQTLIDVTELAGEAAGAGVGVAIAAGAMVDVVGGRRPSSARGSAPGCDFLSAARRIGVSASELVHGLAPRVERLRHGTAEMRSASLPARSASDLDPS
jgi:hypothetical protein